MLTSVNISNYRGFKTYGMEGLARVNLFVGKNNSGKTALLEAIHLVASGGDPWALAEAAQRRGEMSPGRDGRERFPELTHFFFGHGLEVGASFSVRSANGYPAIAVRLTALEESQLELFGAAKHVRPTFRAEFDGATIGWVSPKGLPISERGEMLFESRQRVRDGTGPEMSDSSPVVFIPPASASLRQLAEMWTRAILDGRKAPVLDALRIIQPDLSQLEFLSIDYYSFRPTNAPVGIVVALESEPRPRPLGSMGDGMRRLLALAIALTRASGGVLLLDEIDTGLHYSVMTDMWSLVIETAVRDNIQVFATTHSWDCIRGLGEFCRTNPSRAPEVALHNITPELEKSIPFPGPDLPRVIDNETEVR